MDTTTSPPPEETTPPIPGEDTTTEPTTEPTADPTTEPTTTDEDTTDPGPPPTTEDPTTTEETTTEEPPPTTTDEPTTEDEPTTSPPEPSPSTSLGTTTEPGGEIVTTVITIDPSDSSSPTNSASNSEDRGFFGNTGAVAGVFTVVGVIVLVLIIVLVTSCIRRRRRKQFDRDVDEAAREAAGAQPPIFLDEPEESSFRNQPAFTGYSDRSNAYTGYSDTTHGTYGQPPMTEQYNGESYGMHNMGTQQPYDTGFAGVGAGAAVAGAAGIGVRRSRSQHQRDIDHGMAGFGPTGAHPGFGEDSSPYPAFAAPNAGNTTYTVDSRYPSGGTDPYPAFVAPPHERRSQPPQPRATSGNFNDAATTGAASSQPSYAERYQPGYKAGDQLPPASHEPLPVSNTPRATSVYEDDAYGGYSSHGHGSANDHIPGNGRSPSPPGRDSDNDEDIPRVLKVANR